MASYTIEDIELIRRKSGISYQEAVALLDYHNGNVARALVDLERNGRIKPEATTQKTTTSEKKGSFAALMSKLYRMRIKVRKDATPVLNVSVLFTILGFILGGGGMMLAGAIVSLILGYKIEFAKDDPAFRGDNLERMVKNAAENVKSSVNDFAKGFQEGMDGSRENAEEAAPADNRSYYSKSAAAASATYRPSAPTLNVPVQVESQDGSVTVEAENDGYNSATIE